MKRRSFLKLALALSLAPTVRTVDALAAKGKPRIRIGYLPITDHLSIIAAGRGNFERLELEPVKFSSWPELAEALKAGAVEGAFALTPIGLSLRQKEVPIKVVLLGHRNGSVVTVKNDPALAKAQDLKGKTIAIPSRFSTHNILIRKYLSDNGLDATNDVTLIEMAPPEMVNALATGRVQAFIVAEPFGAQAEMQHVGKIQILSKDIWPDHICCALNLRQNIIESEPAAVEELVARLVDAGRFIESQPKEAATLGTRYLGQKPEVLEYVLTTPKGRVTFNDLAPTPKDFAVTQDYLRTFGVSDGTVDLGAYLDDSFARKAGA